MSTSFTFILFAFSISVAQNILNPCWQNHANYLHNSLLVWNQTASCSEEIDTQRSVGTKPAGLIVRPSCLHLTATYRSSRSYDTRPPLIAHPMSSEEWSCRHLSLPFTVSSLLTCFTSLLLKLRLPFTCCNGYKTHPGST